MKKEANLGYLKLVIVAADLPVGRQGIQEAEVRSAVVLSAVTCLLQAGLRDLREIINY